MMFVIFNGNPITNIASCKSPANARDEPDLVTFYIELSSLVCSIPKHNVLIIGWDINIQMLKNTSFLFRY